jgi:hypothetical protein
MEKMTKYQMQKLGREGEKKETEEDLSIISASLLIHYVQEQEHKQRFELVPNQSTVI